MRCEEKKPDRAEITDDDNFKCAICNLDLKMFALTQNTSLLRFIEMESHNFRSISVYDEFRCKTYLPFLSIYKLDTCICMCGIPTPAMRNNNACYLTSASRECCDFAASPSWLQPILLTCCPGYCNKFFLYGWAWPSKAVINVSLSFPDAPNFSERGKTHSSTSPA